MLPALFFIAASGHAVILSGANDKAAAAALLTAWNSVDSLVQAAGVKPPAGYPKLIHSDDVKGLKPGFWIWVLGYCNKDKATAQLDVIKRVFNGAYQRPVDVPQLDCASVAEDAGFGDEAKLGKVGAYEVRTITTNDKVEGDEEGREDSYDLTVIHVLLYDPKTKSIVDSVPVNGSETHNYGMSSGGGGFSCTTKGGTLKGKTLKLERRCMSPTPECGSYAGGIEKTVVTIDGGSLSADTTKKDINYVECN